jgi:tyrosyl-tRNA synthetase
LTSPFTFYQFWLNTDDADVVTYLKFFTWFDRDTIEELATTVIAAPERREAQRALAREVTTLVHGADQAAGAERSAAVLFGVSLADATAAEILAVFDGVPSFDLDRDTVSRGISIVELLVRAGLAASKGEATRLIRQGGIYVNDGRVQDERSRVTLEQALDDQLIILRKGQRERRVVRLVAR